MARTIDGLDVREMRASDADAVITLVAAAYAEYPGCVLDLPGVDADLPELADRLRAAGGRGWVVTDDDQVVACVGIAPASGDTDPRDGDRGTRPAVERRAAPPSGDPDRRDGDRGTRAELKRLYVAATHRRRGVGRALVELVEDHAVRDHDAVAVELWSDTRFVDAHRLYERCGYVRTGRTRQLHDPSETTEYEFVRALSPG